MQMTGRHQVSVPKAASVTIAVGTANNSLAIFATGDAVLAGDIAANSSTSDISLGANIDERAGFANTNVVIVGYGTENEEQLTVSAAGSPSRRSVPTPWFSRTARRRPRPASRTASTGSFC